MAIDDNNWNIILQSSKTTDIPSGKRLHNNGKSPFPMGKSTISMAIFNSYASLPEGILKWLVGAVFRSIKPIQTKTAHSLRSKSSQVSTNKVFNL